jgi:hypothetical protein
MSGSRPRAVFRKLESGEAVANAPRVLEAPRPVESRIGRFVALTLHGFVQSRSRWMSPARRERTRHEQEIAAAALRGRPTSDD